MKWLLITLAVWLLILFPLAIVIGKAIHFGNPIDEEETQE